MYSLVIVDGEEVKRAKGVNRSVAQNARHRKFVDVLFNRGVVRHKIKRIENQLQRIGTYDVCKSFLS